MIFSKSVNAIAELTGSPLEELSILVDDVLVKQAVLVGFQEGVIGYWPPEVDEETLFLCNRIYLPSLPYTYAVIDNARLRHKYLVIVLNEKFLLLALDKKVSAERLGKRILKAIKSIYRD